VISKENLERRVAERTRELAEAIERERSQAKERERAEAAFRQAQKLEVVGAACFRRSARLQTTC